MMRDGSAAASREDVSRSPRARRVPVVEPARQPYHYADAFEIRARRPDPRSAEERLRASVESASWPVRCLVSFAHRRLIGFDVGPADSRGHVLGWPIVSAEPDAVVLQNASDLAAGVIIARRPAPPLVRVTTFVEFRRPAARLLWVALAPVHRAVAAHLLRGGVRVDGSATGGVPAQPPAH